MQLGRLAPRGGATQAKRKTLRMIALVQAGLALMLAYPAHAQDDPAMSNKTAAAFAQLGQAFSTSAETTATPPTPERLRLVHQYLVQYKAEAAMKAVGQAAYSQTLEQFKTKAAALPARQQAQALTAFSTAFESAEAARIQIALDGMATYFASRLSEDDLKTIIAWNESDLGRRMREQPLTVTQEERQQVGQFTVDHPAMIRLVQVSVSYSKHVLANAPSGKAAFQADFQSRLCQNFSAIQLRMSTCPATATHGRRRPA